MDKYKVTVGAKAYSFHDQSTGITICRGERKKELSARQYRTKKDSDGFEFRSPAFWFLIRKLSTNTPMMTSISWKRN